MASPPHPVDPAEIFDARPAEEYALLELDVEWSDLVGVEAQIAAALRLFVITRDPLDWLPDRGSAWVTANGDGENLELPLYVTIAEARSRLAATRGDVAEALGPQCEKVVLRTIRYQGIVLAGAYPELAFRGQTPGLLGEDGERARLGVPSIAVGHTGWEPIGLGALQDLVQDAFGPVALDRSRIALPPTDEPQARCPACGGIRFGFPGDLTEAQAVMCDRHREAAEEITSSRIARARASNPAGWRAIGKASARTSGLPEPVAMPAPERRNPHAGRNDPCPCGSGRKFKHCCGR